MYCFRIWALPVSTGVPWSVDADRRHRVVPFALLLLLALLSVMVVTAVAYQWVIFWNRRVVPEFEYTSRVQYAWTPSSGRRRRGVADWDESGDRVRGIRGGKVLQAGEGVGEEADDCNSSMETQGLMVDSNGRTQR